MVEEGICCNGIERFVEADDVIHCNMPLLLWYNRNILYGLVILKYY